ncbi:MAG: manganese efflux pump [Clostridia bacterium]|nr:manganese efflux pump [Clostridia bacterium]
MNLGFTFFFNSILLGVGLAMDAFSVSLADGLSEPCMKKRKTNGIAGICAFFQAAMPLIGWFLVHTVASCFTAFEKAIPYIALLLLSFIGGKMLIEGIRCKNEEVCACGKRLTLSTLLVQGIATSIDALSVGFTIAEYGVLEALLCALIIAAVTFFICLGGVYLGKKAGAHLSGKAGILGGVILIFIGLEIFITSFF